MGKEEEGTNEDDDKEDEAQLQKESESLRSKAVHFVSDLTTVLLNPISDKPSNRRSSHDGVRSNTNNGESDSDNDDCSENSVSQPDTSSFSAFLYSLVVSSNSQRSSKTDDEVDSNKNVEVETSSQQTLVVRENPKIKIKRKSLLSRGRQSVSWAFNQTSRLGNLGFLYPQPFKENYGSEGRGDKGICMKTLNDSPMPIDNFLPESSEPSLLLSEKARGFLYASLPVIVKGRKWMLLYSTWRHGISLSTLYRKSLLWPGLSLLVVGDCNGGVFGGLVEAPLRVSSKRYQGTKDSFVFTNSTGGNPVIFRPTGKNRYFTLCSSEYLAMGGGSNFALYLAEDLLSGSSSSSETYGNPCLARARDFEVRGVELWGFVYASKFEEMVALQRSGTPGISQFFS